MQFPIEDIPEKYDKCHISNSYVYMGRRQISVILPYRGDIDSLIEIINNIFSLASYPKKVEMLIRVDSDQEDLYQTLSCHKVVNQYNVKIYSGKRYLAV